MCISTAQARLAQNGVPAPGARPFSWKFLRNNGSCDMSMCISMAQVHAKCVPRVSQSLDLLHFHDFECKFSHKKRGLVEILLRFSLRGPSIIPYKSWTEDLVEILAGSFLRGPCVWSLQMPSLRGVCIKAVVGAGFGRFLCQDLVRPAPAGAGPFYDDLVKFSLGPGMKILFTVFNTSLCEDLVQIPGSSCWRPLHDLVQVLVGSSRGPEILSVSLHDLVQVLVRRSSGDPVESLLKRSLQ